MPSATHAEKREKYLTSAIESDEIIGGYNWNNGLVDPVRVEWKMVKKITESVSIGMLSITHNVWSLDYS